MYIKLSCRFMHIITKLKMKDEQGLEARVLNGKCHPSSAFMIASRSICAVINMRGCLSQHRFTVSL